MYLKININYKCQLFALFNKEKIYLYLYMIRLNERNLIYYIHQGIMKEDNNNNNIIISIIPINKRLEIKFKEP